VSSTCSHRGVNEPQADIDDLVILVCCIDASPETMCAGIQVLNALAGLDALGEPRAVAAAGATSGRAHRPRCGRRTAITRPGDFHGTERGFTTSAMTPPKDLATLIHQGRLAKGLNRREVARALGVTPDRVIGWETGHIVPTFGTVAALIDLLGLDPNATLSARLAAGDARRAGAAASVRNGRGGLLGGPLERRRRPPSP